MTHDYESLRQELSNLHVLENQERDMFWPVQALAIGRNAQGDLEIFIVGDELVASSSLVRRHVQHGKWQASAGGQPFAANRIMLPSADHFDSVASLIAIELLRAGVSAPDGPQKAFSDVEPIIEMAIRRGALPETVVIGLLGELIILRQLLLLSAADPSIRGDVLNCWNGWQRGRDFLIGRHSIEVKATQENRSSHEFSGLHQLEPATIEGGALEQLHLMSFGLTTSPAAGDSLPSMIDSILMLLAEGSSEGLSPLQEAFLRNVEAYGSAQGIGYAHLSMSQWSAYGTRYAPRFSPRLYRVDDPAMLLLSRAELAQTFVEPNSISFTAHLPDQVSAFNPAPLWIDALAQMLKEWSA